MIKRTTNNMPGRIFVICFLAMWACCNTVSAQKSTEQYDPDKLYKQAMEMYEKEKYTAARKLFADVTRYSRFPCSRFSIDENI